MNRKGVIAFLDCMIFLIVIMGALSVTMTTHNNDESSDFDPEDFLTRLSKTEVRLSDLTDIDDDNLIYIADVMAYDTANESIVRDYLENVLSRMFGQHRYLMTYEYGGITVSLGEMKGFYHYQSVRDIKISTGNSIYVCLSVK